MNGTWNGKQFVVAPGETMFPVRTAEAIKRQDPLMGSQTGDFWDTFYLCGIKEQGDDISTIEQSDSQELMNPAVLHAATIAMGHKVATVAGVSGMYRSRQSVAAELPTAGRNDIVASGFEKP